jgi:hypothetical protein
VQNPTMAPSQRWVIGIVDHFSGMQLMREQSDAEIVASSAEERKHLYDVFNTPERLDFLKNHWPFFARPSQLPPSGSWSNWLILAGRGFGKTRTGAEWVRANMCGPSPLMAGRWRHIALVAETSADARAVVVGDGKAVSDPTAGSGILQVHPKDSALPMSRPNGA